MKSNTNKKPHRGNAKVRRVRKERRQEIREEARRAAEKRAFLQFSRSEHGC